LQHLEQRIVLTDVVCRPLADTRIVIENNTLNGDDVIGCASDGVTCSSNT